MSLDNHASGNGDRESQQITWDWWELFVIDASSRGYTESREDS